MEWERCVFLFWGRAFGFQFFWEGVEYVRIAEVVAVAVGFLTRRLGWVGGSPGAPVPLVCMYIIPSLRFSWVKIRYIHYSMTYLLTGLLIYLLTYLLTADLSTITQFTIFRVVVVLIV